MDEMEDWLADEIAARPAQKLYVQRIHRGEGAVELDERRRRQEVEQRAVVVLHLLAELPDQRGDPGVPMERVAGLRRVQNERMDDGLDQRDAVAGLVEESTAEKRRIL